MVTSAYDRLALLTLLAGLSTASGMAACGTDVHDESPGETDSGDANGHGADAADAMTTTPDGDHETALDSGRDTTMSDTGLDADANADVTIDGKDAGGEAGDDSGPSEASSDAADDTDADDGESGTSNDAQGDIATEAAIEASSDAEPDVASEAAVDAPSDVAGDATRVVCPPAVHSGSSAVTHQIDPQHTGSQPGDVLTLPLCHRWTHSFGAGASLTEPVVQGGLVFVMAGPSNGQQAVYALHERTGAIVWGPTNLGGAGVGWAAGLALEGGRLFAVSGDGVMASFDPATGSMSWQTQLTGQYFWYSAPVALGGTVFVSGAESGSTLYAVRESDGALLWTSSAAFDTSSPTVANGAVFLHDNCGAAYRLDANTGAIVWSHPGTCGGSGHQSIAILGGQLYVPDVANYTVGGVVIDPATGAQVGNTFDSVFAPAGSGGVGYFIPYLSRAVSAISLGTTTPVWTSGSDLSESPIVVGSSVVIGSGYGLYVYSAVDGSLVSSVPRPVRTGSSGTPGLQEADGLLFVVTNGGLVAY